LIPEFVTQGESTQRVPKPDERGTAADLVRRGQAAARSGDNLRAARLLKASLIADPSDTEARLWLAAVTENPEESLRLLTEVLQEQPDNPRAAAGLRWACDRLEARAAARPRLQPLPCPQVHVLPEAPRSQHGAVLRVLVALLCLVGIVGGSFLVASYSWVEAEPPSPVAPLELAPASLNDTQMIELPPLYMPVPTADLTQVPEAGAEPPTTTDTAALSPTLAPVTAMAVPTAKPRLQTVANNDDPSTGNGTYAGKWIEVILSKQVLIAWQGNTPVRRMAVSTGIARYPTVTGSYRIYVKLRSQAMRGPGYYLPNVPHVMFFYRGYGIHGTYWHNNFGTPMSHGCVNLSQADAAWLFSWAGPWLPAGRWSAWASASNPGTLVVVHW